MCLLAGLSRVTWRAIRLPADYLGASLSSLVWLELVILGIVVGAYGTVIGAGGGFVPVPLLLLLYPSESAELVTSISLAVVSFNALSSMAAYVRQRRVDFLAANSFALATVPGSSCPWPPATSAFLKGLVLG